MPNALRKLNSLQFEFFISLSSLALTLISPRWWLVDAGSDDLLYVRQALAIKSGNWLGSFGDGGGIKLPGFQIYLALFSFTSIPFYIGIILIQIIGAFLIRNYFKRIFPKNYIYKVIFAFCVFNPALYGANNARLLRDGFYSSLLTVLFGLALNLHLEIVIKSKDYTLKIVKFFTLFVLVSTWIAFTREETYAFIFFDIALILAISLLSNLNKVGFKFAGTFVAIALTVFGVSSLVIQQANKIDYGTASMSSIQSGPIISLENQWSRVEPISGNPRMLVSYAQRNLIYSAVPDIGAQRNTLEKYLKWYLGPSCGQAGICNDIGAGWTFWGLFYGLTMGEGLNNPQSFNSEVIHMNQEIQNFCQSKSGLCDNTFRLPTIGTAKNFLPILGEIPVEFMRSVLQSGNTDPVSASSGSLRNLQQFQQLVSLGGPPNQWSTKPIGNRDAPYIAMILCLLLLIWFLTRKNKVIKIDSVPQLRILAPFTFLLILILFRIFVTSTVSVVGWNVSRSNYEMPSNVLSWILVAQLATFLMLIYQDKTDSKLTSLN